MNFEQIAALIAAMVCLVAVCFVMPKRKVRMYRADRPTR